MEDYKIYELAFKDLDEWEEKDILNVVQQQFSVCQQNDRLRKTIWTEELKLYLNQFKKQIGELQLGSKLLFTQFHDVYSSVDNDKNLVNFEARSPKDVDKIYYTNAVARFDFNEMGFSTVRRELNWNIIFYGTGILDVSTYDTSQKLLLPLVQSPFLFFIDPKATSIDNARFAGRYIYKTLYDLKQDERLDESKIKGLVKVITPSSSYEFVQYERRAKQILVGDNYYEEPLTPSALFEILEWYFYNNGKLWVVWTDNGIKNLLGFQKVDYKDKKDKQSKIPFIVSHFIKTPFSIYGIGLADVVEDFHRADVILKNYLFKGISFDAVPTFLVNLKALINPKDLLTKEINKNIFTNVPPTGQIAPFPKTQVVSNDTLTFMNVLQNEVVGAVGSSKILKGSLTQVKKTATEIAIAKAKQDLQLSSIMRNIISGEIDFWYRWLKRHKRFMKEDDKKLVTLLGSYGSSRFTEIRKSEFIPETDPHIEIVSSLISEPNKLVRRRELTEMFSVLAQTGGNVREVLKKILYDMDMSPEEVEVIMPPTPHEMRAKLENELLEEDEYVEVLPEDDDLQHIAEHYKIEETEARQIHIYAHNLNYLRKQKLKEPQEKQKKPEMSLEDVLNVENLPEALKEVTAPKTEKEGMEALRSPLIMQTPTEIK